MTEYRIITFRQPLAKLIPPELGAAKSLTIDFAGSAPELADYMDGWDVINSQIIPAGDEVLLIFVLRLDARAPESPAGLSFEG